MYGGKKLQLKAGEDFDALVLAVGLGEVPFVGDLLERFPRWQVMTEKVKTVATKAMQLWVSEDEALGWRDDSVNLTGIPGPYETWADMTHLIAHEVSPTSPNPSPILTHLLPRNNCLPRMIFSIYRLSDGIHLWGQALLER